jgi:hypothetical protein
LSKQSLDIPRFVLPVGVELNRRLVAMSYCETEASSQCPPDPNIERETRDTNACFACYQGGFVGGAVVHNEDVKVGGGPAQCS